MKIIRGDQEIELTREELFEAYEELVRNYDMQNIANNMPVYLDSDIYAQ